MATTTHPATTLTAIGTYRARFFSLSGLETLPCEIEDDSAITLRARVRPWDEIAGAYTVCHALTPAATRRILRAARATVA